MKKIIVSILILVVFSCRTNTKNENVASPINIEIEEIVNNHTIRFNIPDNLKKYYTGLLYSDDKSKFYDELATHTISKHSNFLSYGERHNYLYNIDEDPDNKSNVILMYSSESRSEKEYMSGRNKNKPQTFNTEHIYPQSKIENTAKGDLHHLRVCDSKTNSKRSNFPFTEGKDEFKLINRNSWYPGDKWKGDVARMIMYLNLRYNEPFSEVGKLELFLKWNVEDPVSNFEKQRNNRIQKAQGNRNPFIDNPYLVTLTWGGKKAENKWE